MALTNARSTPRRMDSTHNDSMSFGCAASSTFYVGALVCTNSSGYLTPGATATTLTAAGVIGEQPHLLPAKSYASTSTNGETKLEVQRGVFKFDNDGTNPVTVANLLKVVYIVDDATVSSLSTGRSVAGICLGVDDATSPTGAGVWVEVGGSLPG